MEKDLSNKEKGEGLFDKKGSLEERVEEIYEKKKEGQREKELLSKTEKIIKEKLEREINLIKLTPELQEEAKKKAEEIELLDEKGKLKKLLGLAQDKGISFAIRVAKTMDDPYILDVLHDILAKDEFYKKFPK